MAQQLKKRIMKTSLLVVLLFVVGFGYAQTSNVSITSGGDRFVFKNGVSEWSEPVKINLEASATKKNPAISTPISMRIRVKKRMLLACHYEVEITNLSTTSQVSFKYKNSYTDATGKDIWHSVKLKPSGVAEGKIIYAELKFKPKSVEDCSTCSWSFDYAELKVK